jgi:F1F0 ATPase subunit 2
MSEPLILILALHIGILLGILFFGGLWLTVRKAMASKIPALWFFASLTIRVGTVLIGFYWVMQRASWIDGLLCLLGFITGRLMVIRFTKTYESRANTEMKNIKS